MMRRRKYGFCPRTRISGKTSHLGALDRVVVDEYHAARHDIYDVNDLAHVFTFWSPIDLDRGKILQRQSAGKYFIPNPANSFLVVLADNSQQDAALL